MTILPVSKDDIEGRGAGGKNGHLQTTTSKCTDAKPSARLRVRGVPSTERPARYGRRSEAIRSAPGLRGSPAHLPLTPTEATRATAPLPAASRSRPIPHGPVSPPPQAGRGPHAATSPAVSDRAASHPSAARPARGRPGARGSGRGGRQAQVSVLGRTAELPSLERHTRRGPAGDAHSPSRSCGGRRPGPRRTATRPPSRHPRCELPPPPSRRHRSPVGFPASCGGGAPSPLRVRGAAGPPGIGGPASGRPSAPGRDASPGTVCRTPLEPRFHLSAYLVLEMTCAKKKNDTPRLPGHRPIILSPPPTHTHSCTHALSL